VSGTLEAMMEAGEISLDIALPSVSKDQADSDQELSESSVEEQEEEEEDELDDTVIDEITARFDLERAALVKKFTEEKTMVSSSVRNIW